MLCMAGHMINLATMFEDPKPISSWFMSHNVSRWLSLTMHTRPLRMRQITWSVKGNLNDPLQSFSRTSIYRTELHKGEHIVAFTAIFSNICTTHAQKRLFMNFRCKFRLQRSILRPRVPIRVQKFSYLATFSVHYCILYSECPPYFYFRFVWPTGLQSIPHASKPHW